MNQETIIYNLLFDLLFDLILELWIVIDLYYSILILFFHQERYLVTVRLFFTLFRALPIKKSFKKKRLDYAITVYKRRMKIYSIFALIGGLLFSNILISEIIELIIQTRSII